jgi:lipopolysaccharide transport system ATP-binding protein
MGGWGTLPERFDPAVATHMSGAVAITCQGLSKSFALVDQGSAWRLAIGAGSGIAMFDALRDVSLEVPKGQFVGILGRNGAGKSTLLRTMGGVYTADRGRVTINGSLSGLYELGLAGNPQLTGRQYADRLLTINGFGRRDRAMMVADIHEFSELGDRFDDAILTYSAGMGARLFFAAATAGRYQVYLLDEVLSVGDQHFQAKCWRRLRDRVAQGASGVLVTHDWAAILRVCATTHVLDRGQIAFSGPAQRAVSIYLYGRTARETYEPGIARFTERPTSPVVVQAGDDLRVPLAAVVERPAEVALVGVIERLQPGYGWETALMSRAPVKLAQQPGRYKIDFYVPRLPLEPGSYQISVHLVMLDSELSGRRRLLDGLSFLNGDSIPLQVEQGAHAQGLTLPTSWTIRAT